MNSILKYILFIIVTSFIFFGCEDDEAVRVPEFQNGANVRLQLAPESQSINFADLQNSALTFSVYSENDNIEEIEITGTYYNFELDSAFEKRVLVTLAQNDFNNGMVEDISFSTEDLAAIFEVPGGIDGIGGGDRFDIFNKTTLTNGLVFPDTTIRDKLNVEQGIITGESSSFTYSKTVFVACPIEETFATGKYKLEQIEGPSDLFFGDPYIFAPEVVNIEAVTPIERTFSVSYYTFTGIDFNFLLICGNVLVGTTSSGLSCGGPDLGWTGASDPGTYNDADDSEIIIKVLDNPSGACGLPIGVPTTLKLTKVE